MKTMSTILKAFGAILTTAGVITLAVKIVTAYQSGASERQQILHKVTTVEQKVDGLNTTVRQLSQGQEDMRTDINSLSRANVNLKDYMMRTAASKGDVKELMNVIQIWEDEKKKNGIEIPLKETQQN
jgi:outer membrane murein-binding lipoprotein Lpp